MKNFENENEDVGVDFNIIGWEFLLDFEGVNFENYIFDVVQNVWFQDIE